MKNVANAFFVLAVLAVTLGMLWGIQMAASQDHTMAPAHAHLNLVGFVAFAIFAFYYHLTPAAGESGLARAHLVLAVAGLVLIVPGIAMARVEMTEAVAIAGSFASLGSMALFLFVVLRHGLGRAAA